VKARAGLALAVTAWIAASSAPAPAAPPATWKSRMASAVRYAESRAGTISFAVVDEGGRLHGYRARAVAPSASVLKAMLLVAYLRRSDVRDRELAAWERGLLAPMIQRSDNAAAARMVGLVGARRLDRLAHVAGMEHFRLHWPVWGASEITPRGQALFFDRIDRLVPNRHRAYAMHLLATVVPSQRWGVGRVSHGRWHLYFKGGWGSGTGLVDHQVALYRAEGERFSLALFTRFDPDHAYGKETLRGLAALLLHGVARPQERLAHARRAALGGGYAVTTRGRCGHLAIRRPDGSTRSFATGATSCAGFRLAAAGSRALWAWPESGGSRLAAAAFGSGAVDELGMFDGTDTLGALAGGGKSLAYAHGTRATVLHGPDCPAPANAVLAADGDRIATASGSAVEIRDSASCAPVRSLTASGEVESLALDGGFATLLSRTPSGRVRIERFRISTGALLGRTAVSTQTLPVLAARRAWILSRTPHALQLLSVRSGRSWTVWRSARVPVAAGTSARRVTWVENHGGAARLWSIQLPAD
jgi:hypothetical protein